MHARKPWFLVMFFLAAPLAAQTDLQERRQTLENAVESRILSEVRKYYPDLRLLLSAEVAFRPVAESQDAAAARDLTLPGVKGFEAARPSTTAGDPQILRIQVRLLFDKNAGLDNAQLTRLLENIAYYAGKLSRGRGDRVDIEGIAFPKSKEELETQVSPPSQPPLAAGQPSPELISKPFDSTAPQTVARPADEGPVANDQNQAMQKADMLPPYAVVAVGLLALLLAVVAFWLLLRLRTERRRAATEREMLERQVSAAAASQMAHEEAVPATVERARAHRDVKRLATTLISSAVGTPEVFASILKDWVGKPDRKEIVQVVVGELGPSLLNVVEHALTADEIRQLKTLAVDKSQREPEASQTALETLSTELKLRQASAAKEEKKNPFAFLQNMNEAQLFLLMKDQPAGIVAILLSQLPPGLAGSLLRNLPSMQQGEVALELVKLRRLTSDAYVSVAKELASKAARIPAINNVQVQGTDLLLDIFDSLDETEEHSISEYIKVMNVEMYRQIADQRVAFSAFSTLDDRIIRQLMKDMPGEEVALALKQAPDSIRSKFLSVLPSRAKALLEERISGLDGVSPDDEQKMRRKMTRMIRNYLRVGKIESTAANS